MTSYFCLGHLICGNAPPLPVNFVVQNGDFTINVRMSLKQQLPVQTPIATLPAGANNSILKWYNQVDERRQLGTFCLHNTEDNINVEFELPLKDLRVLENILRCKQIFYRNPAYEVIGELVPQKIKLIKYQGAIFIEKMAPFPEFAPGDPMALLNLFQLKKESDVLRTFNEYNHKNIIKMYDVCTDQNGVSIILENCEGGDLFKVMKESQQLDIRVIMEGLMEGLAHIHRYDIYHRDIKLQNIFFKDSNMYSLKIADFGLSCHKDELNCNNQKCGTPGYAAPEVFSGQYDEKIDIFSAGVVLYNLLTHKNPFGSSKNVQEIIERNQKGDFDQVPLIKVKQSNPLALDLLLKMLEKNPKQRLSAAECLKHPFFGTEDQIQEEDSVGTVQVQKMKVYQQKSHQMPMVRKSSIKKS